MGPNDPVQPGTMPPPPPGGPGAGAPPPPPSPVGGPGPEHHHEDVMRVLGEIKDMLAKVAAKVGA